MQFRYVFSHLMKYLHILPSFAGADDEGFHESVRLQADSATLQTWHAAILQATNHVLNQKDPPYSPHRLQPSSPAAVREDHDFTSLDAA